MAKSIEEVIGRQINSVKELRAAIREYQDSLIGVDTTSEEFKETTEKLRVAQDELNKVTRAGKDAMDAASDSIVGMERQYKDLYNQYKLLTEEQRNSDFGKNMAESLNQLSNKLNETKQGVGNFKDNIGRYTSSIMDAFQQMGGSVGGLVGPFKTATQGVQAFNATLKANPVGAVITLIMALVNVIKQLSGSIKDNEESQMRLNQAMASFQPIIDGVKNAFDKVGQAIVSVVEFIAKAVDKIREAKAAFTDFLGITKGAKEQIKEQQKIYQDLAKSVNELTKTKREYQKLNAADKSEVERLREEASETTNLAEKKKLLEEAKAKQAEIDQRNIEIAKEELRILEVQDSLTANSAEDNEKLAAAIAKVSEAEAAAAANMRQYNKQLNATTNTTKSAASSMKSIRDEAKKIYEDTIENSKSEVQKLTEKYEKELALLKKYHYDTKKLTEQYNKELAKIQAEADEKSREKTKSAFKQRRDDIQQEWDLLKREGSNDTALLLEAEGLEKKTIPAVEKLDEKVKNFLKSFGDEDLFKQLLPTKGFNDAWDEAYKGMKKMEDFINENTFEGLGDEYEDIKKAVRAVNDEFGLTITTVANLNNTLREQKLRLEEIDNEFKQMEEDKSFNEKVASFLDQRIKLLESFTDEKGTFKTDQAQAYYNQVEALADQELEAEIEHYQTIISLTKEGTAERLDAMENYYAALDEKRQRDLDKEQAALDQKVAKLENFGAFTSDFTQSLTDSSNGIISLANGYKTLYNAQIQEGKLNKQEVEAKKKRMLDLEKVVLAASIAQIVASTAQGMVDTWTGYIKETSVVNPQTAAAAGVGAAGALAVLNAASLAKAIGKSVGLAATAAGQIAAARGGYISNVTNLQSEGSAGAAAASVSTPSEPDYIPFQYTRQVQTFAEEDELNRPIWVSVQDIDAAQNRVEVRDQESSF